MKEMRGTLTYKDTDYDLVFDLNVMEQIQDEYGTIERWSELTDGKEIVLDKNGNPLIDDNGDPITKPKEVDARALKFGIWCMINEGIEIKNEEEGSDLKPITKNQVGRMLTTYGLAKATEIANQSVIDSITTDDAEKNL